MYAFVESLRGTQTGERKEEYRLKHEVVEKLDGTKLKEIIGHLGVVTELVDWVKF